MPRASLSVSGLSPADCRVLLESTKLLGLGELEALCQSVKGCVTQVLATVKSSKATRNFEEVFSVQGLFNDAVSELLDSVVAEEAVTVAVTVVAPAPSPPPSASSQGSRQSEELDGSDDLKSVATDAKPDRAAELKVPPP